MSDQLTNNLTGFTQVNEAIKTAKGGKKIKGFAKWLTYIIIIVAFSVGVIGSFGIGNFSMDAYTQFLPVASLFIIPLIVSIGASSITGKIVQGRKERDAAIAHEVSAYNNHTEETVG